MNPTQINPPHAARSDKLRGAISSPRDFLLKYQQRWVEDTAKFKIGVQSRQTGKSFCTACEAVSDSLADPGTKWVCLSAGERQALEWLEKCKEWAQAYKLVVASASEERLEGEALLRQAQIRFTNGSRILAIPANPSTARGYSANVVLDEFAYHENPGKIWAAMFPSLTNPLAGTFLTRVRALCTGWNSQAEAGPRRSLKIRIVSTFNGRENKFFQLWQKRIENGYSAHLVTIHDAMRQGLRVNLEELRSGLDDPTAWAQEFECEPSDTSNVLLPYDLIALAESAEASETVSSDFYERGNASNPLYCGIDFGRTNDPTVCWTLEKVGGILWTREVLVLQNMPTPEQIDHLRRRLKRAARAAWDNTGPGVGGGDFLQKEFGLYNPAAHEFGKIELCNFTLPFKRDLFPRLRQAFVAPTQLRIPISRAIREDLHSMQQVVHNGEYNYWARRTREGHSDRCTALALALHASRTCPADGITAETLRKIRMGPNAPRRSYGGWR